MSASIKILTTSTLDSSPSVLFISPNGRKTLINCGEGCQRSFLEASERVRSVNQICLTHIGHDATGGLPGMILTSADAAAAGAAAAGAASSDDNETPPSTTGGLEVIGPIGTKAFMHSLRHFVRRDRFVVDTKEGYQVSQASEIDRVKKGKKRKNCGDSTVGEQSRGMYGVTTIPLKQTLQTLNSKEVDIHIASYIFSTPKVPGKFQVKKAKELGIPPGPMYATLKGGASVTFKHPLTGIETTVQPHEVLEGGSDGVSAIVLYCPDEVVMEQLCGGVTHGANPGMEQLELLKVGSERNANLEAIIHFTPKTLFCSPKYQTWLANFGVEVKHIALHPIERQSWNGGNEEVDGSPFKAAMLGAMTRNLLNPEIYQNPICPIRPDETLKELPNQSAQNYIKALRHMEYKLIPLSKQGIVPESISNRSGDDYRSGISAEERLAIENLTIESGAKSSSNAIRERHLEELSHSEDDQNENQIPSNENLSGGEFFFTGTGSAIPCKHRNVTGMYMQMTNENAMLLDVGEGTLGQLLRFWSSTHRSEINTRIQKIKAVFISHPHADHHLGIVRLLTERNALLSQANTANNESIVSINDKIVIMCPTSMIHFLEEYQAIDPTISGGYVTMDCLEMLPGKTSPFTTRLQQDLGLTRCLSVMVSHCYHSYAFVADGTAFGRLVYSGDCRPSDRLVEIGKDADLLIHEATFEDGMEAEAVLKRHSTVGEALDVGRRMNAKAVILTHFSQRYPKIPPLTEAKSEDEGRITNFPIIFAFDFMKVSCRRNIDLASRLTSAIRLLYDDKEDNFEDNEFHIKSGKTAEEILSKPGLFAEKISCQN